MHKLTDSDIRYLLNQDRLTKLEGVALLTGGYQEQPSNLDRLAGRPSKILAFQDVLDHREPRPKKPENLLVYEKILEIDETIERSLGYTLIPVEDMLDLSVIGADGPTFETWHFLEWATSKGFVPPSLSQDLQPFFTNQSKGCVDLYPSLNAEQQGKRGSFAGQVEIESENFSKVVGHIKTIGCSKIKDDEVVQLLEKNGIRYDYPKMTKDEIEATVNRLRENEISNRIIAFILDWPRIQNREVKLESVIRRLPR